MRARIPSGSLPVLQVEVRLAKLCSCVRSLAGLLLYDRAAVSPVREDEGQHLVACRSLATMLLHLRNLSETGA